MTAPAAEELALDGTIYAVRFSPIDAFAAIDEPGAEALATTPSGQVIIAASGTVMFYGAGGAGKTTLVVDLSIALAAGRTWLELVAPARALRIALVENEGPRAEFRRKLRAKLATLGVGDLEGRLVVLEEPWAELTLADETHRCALAAALASHETDLLVLGPLVSAGEFPTGGTPDEIRRFEEHVADLRRQVARPLAIVLVHHENRAGQTSGAWERFPDTLVHVTAQGNGRTRIEWKKARWASDLHSTSTTLPWAEGETFTVDERPELTEETMREAIVEAVRANPGISWTKVLNLHDSKGKKLVRGNGTELASLRDALLAAGTVVNLAPRDDQFRLHLADERQADLSDAGKGLERLSCAPPADEDEPTLSPVPYVSRNGDGKGTDRSEPETSFEAPASLFPRADFGAGS